jgi:hypothetical protein
MQGRVDGQLRYCGARLNVSLRSGSAVSVQLLQQTLAA